VATNIHDAKRKLLALENDIFGLIVKYNKETGLLPTHISIDTSVLERPGFKRKLLIEGVTCSVEADT
jgi:hypothetical protein